MLGILLNLGTPGNVYESDRRSASYTSDHRYQLGQGMRAHAASRKLFERGAPDRGKGHVATSTRDGPEAPPWTSRGDEVDPSASCACVVLTTHTQQLQEPHL
eukprot:COSAG02_NODE_21685_length_778_cov_4.801178_1_plen_102_part_00